MELELHKSVVWVTAPVEPCKHSVRLFSLANSEKETRRLGNKGNEREDDEASRALKDKGNLPGRVALDEVADISEIECVTCVPKVIAAAGMAPAYQPPEYQQCLH